MSTYNRDNSNGKTRDVNAVKRVELALKLSAQHVSYDEIARQCGYGSRGAAHNAVMRELDRVVVKNVEELRQRDLHMLDVMHGEVWVLFMDRKNRYRLAAADRLLNIAERRARLMGLDQTKDDALAANMVIVREIPSGYLEEPKS